MHTNLLHKFIQYYNFIHTNLLHNFIHTNILRNFIQYFSIHHFQPQYVYSIVGYSMLKLLLDFLAHK